MDFGFTVEEELFRKTVRQFAQRELRPKYAERERWDYPIHELQLRLGELGLLGLTLAREHGGAGASCVIVGIATEETARADYNAASPIMSTGLAEMIAKYASAHVRDEWLPDLVSGRRYIGLGLTEPHCGSDAVALTTTAARDGDEWLITGEKSSNSRVDAEATLIFARSRPSTGASGISAFLVPLDLPGIGRSPINDLGMKLSRRGVVHFDGVRIPAHNLIGEEGRGLHMVLNGFDYTRGLIALQCIGTAMQSVEETIEYAKSRSAFGSPIARFQGVAFPIAEMLTQLEAARLFAYRVLWLRDRNLPHTKESAMVKWLGPKLAAESIHQMLLLHGHAGYSDDYPHGQRLRDVIGHQIGEGTGEIMKRIAARAIFGRDASPD